MSDAGAAEAKQDSTEAPPKASPRDVLKGCVNLLNRAVKTKDVRVLPARALRQMAGVRRQTTSADIQAVATDSLATTCPLRDVVISTMQAEAKRDGSSASSAAADATDGDDAKKTGPSSLPEAEVLLCIAAAIKLQDAGRVASALPLLEAAMERLVGLNRRSLDLLAARVYFYYSWAHEVQGTLSNIRPQLLALHRTAVLRHDEVGQETLLNLVLRNYLHYKLYDQAEHFRSQVQGSSTDTMRSTQQLSRYLHYLGRIRAIQLDYTEARDCLQQALRKAPGVARGFRATNLKWLTLVRLLLGEVPDRMELTQAQTMTAMAPYIALTQAVRRGDLKDFQRVSEVHGEAFDKDGTTNLIVRLRNNVIRAGLRRISVSYSRISLGDVASLLGLDRSQKDTECIVAKAIRDGAVDATLEHDSGCMVSNQVLDIYATYEPQHAFHARVTFCLDLHNEAMKAMRFEPKAKATPAGGQVLMTDEDLAEAFDDDDEF